MKIYNKKKFVSGVFCISIGTLNLIMDIWRNNIAISGLVLIFVLLIIGSSEITRSLSRKLSKEDKLDELDERNRFIERAAMSKAFQLTQGISFVLMLAMLIMGKVSSYDGFINMGVGVGFVFSISIFTQIFTHIYYESKN
ncbi:MAG: hypothetical protein ACOX7F_00920 [Eubacteriales bacterium]|jgi:hypothetical protein